MTLINRTLSIIADELHAALKHETDEIINIGGLLIEAKAHLKHGKWLPWLRNEFSMSERSAQRYMKVHEFAKSATVADFNLSPTVLYLLSADDYWKGVGCEREVREEATAAVLKEAAKKRVGFDEAKNIIVATWKAEDREEAQRDAMESDMEDAKRDASTNGNEWDDIKDAWIKQWIANKWDEAEFEAEWKKRWVEDCGPTQEAEEAAQPDAEAGPVKTAPEETSEPAPQLQDVPTGARDDEGTFTAPNQTSEPANPRSGVKSEYENDLEFTALCGRLLQEIGKQGPDHFEAADIPAEELAKLGKFLMAVAKRKKLGIKPAAVYVPRGNGTVSPEQSGDEMKAKMAALAARDDDQAA
jgi:hypothetical protein